MAIAHPSDVERIETGLAPQARLDLAGKLGDHLDALYELMIRTQVYHWNVEGSPFDPVHKLTEAQHTAMFAAVDRLAERVRALDVKPAVYVNACPKGVCNIPEELPAESTNADLVHRNENLVRRMRPVVEAVSAVNDVVNAHLLTGFVQQQEKDAWMLRSMLQGQPSKRHGN